MQCRQGRHECVGAFLGARQLLLVREYGAQQSLHAPVQGGMTTKYARAGTPGAVAGLMVGPSPGGRVSARSSSDTRSAVSGSLRNAIGEPAPSKWVIPNACASGLRTHS